MVQQNQNMTGDAWFTDPSRQPIYPEIRARLARLMNAEAEPVVATLPSPDGRWLAQAIPDPESDRLTWQIRDAQTDEIAETLRHVYPTDIAWTGDSQGLFYNQQIPFASGHALMYHPVGTPQRDDLTLRHDPGHLNWFYQPGVSPDGRWLAVSTLNGSPGNRLTLYPLTGHQPDLSRPLPVAPDFRGRVDIVGWDEDALVLLSTAGDAPNGRLLSVDLSSGEQHPLFTESKGPLIHAVGLGQGWVLSTLEQGHAGLLWLPGPDQPPTPIPLPGLGTVTDLFTEQDDLRFVYTDFTRPPQRYGWQPGQPHVQLLEKGPGPGSDPAAFTVQIREIPVGDVTVPLFLAHLADVHPTDRPTLLTAYGGMGHRQTPHFSPEIAAWLEMGGVFASVCARGGGELGAAWHAAAVSRHKQRTFDDVLAVARWLIDRGITSARQLGLWGVSNGGLTAGACLAQDPDLFGAVVIDSGLLDMLSYPALGQGALWLAEYGSPADPEMASVLKRYSPLHRIEPGRSYPPVLLTTHETDLRVGEAHSTRFAQKLAEAGSRPILRVRPGSGHGPPLDPDARTAHLAEILTFLAVNLELAP